MGLKSYVFNLPTLVLKDRHYSTRHLYALVGHLPHMPGAYSCIQMDSRIQWMCNWCVHVRMWKKNSRVVMVGDQCMLTVIAQLI